MNDDKKSGYAVEAIDEDSQDKLQDFDELVKTQNPNYKMWEIGYYQPFFNVDTDIVISRIKKLASPFGDGKFFEEGHVDMYAPF